MSVLQNIMYEQKIFKNILNANIVFDTIDYIGVLLLASKPILGNECNLVWV